MSENSNDQLKALQQEVSALSALFRDRISDDPVKKQAFDQLYEELKAYKDDWQFQAEKPLFLDLLLFFDSLHWFKDALQKGEMSNDAAVDSFQYLIDEFLELLYRRDVVPVQSEELFDRRIHKAVQAIDTDDPRKDQRVHQVLKRGFVRGDRPLRPEEVVVYRHRSGSDG